MSPEFLSRAISCLFRPQAKEKALGTRLLKYMYGTPFQKAHFNILTNSAIRLEASVRTHRDFSKSNSWAAFAGSLIRAQYLPIQQNKMMERLEDTENEPVEKFKWVFTITGPKIMQKKNNVTSKYWKEHGKI